MVICKHEEMKVYSAYMYVENAYELGARLSLIKLRQVVVQSIQQVEEILNRINSFRIFPLMQTTIPRHVQISHVYRAYFPLQHAASLAPARTQSHAVHLIPRHPASGISARPTASRASTPAF
jgi:hypothetical protein